MKNDLDLCVTFLEEATEDVTCVTMRNFSSRDVVTHFLKVSKMYNEKCTRCGKKLSKDDKVYIMDINESTINYIMHLNSQYLCEECYNLVDGLLKNRNTTVSFAVNLDAVDIDYDNKNKMYEG